MSATVMKKDAHPLLREIIDLLEDRVDVSGCDIAMLTPVIERLEAGIVDLEAKLEAARKEPSSEEISGLVAALKNDDPFFPLSKDQTTPLRTTRETAAERILFDRRTIAEMKAKIAKLSKLDVEFGKVEAWIAMNTDFAEGDFAGEKGAEGLIAALQRLKDAPDARIEAARDICSETAPSYKHRCTKIMSVLGFDYGDPDEILPDEPRRLKAAEEELQTVRKLLVKAAIPLEAIHAAQSPIHPDTAKTIAETLVEIRSYIVHDRAPDTVETKKD